MTLIKLGTQPIPELNSSELNESVGVSQLGTVLFDDLTFPAGSWRSLQGIDISYPEVKLQAVRFTVSQAKNIVRTKKSGSAGTVKEYTSSGDFIINCNAVITGISDIYPQAEIFAFKTLADAETSLPVISKILNSTFEVDLVVLTDYTVNPGNAGSAVNVAFKLESDQEFDLSEFRVR